MPRFADQTISAFVEALSSAEPTPGGGTASAVAAAIATALLMMVAGLPKTRSNSDEERTALSEARAALTSIRDRLLVLADEDTDAYNTVIAAYRLPKATEMDKSARKGAIATAMRAATDAPLETLRTAREAVAQAKVVAEYGNPSAVSDVRVALELLEASAAGAAANVEVNLTSLDDEGFRKSAASAMIELGNQITEGVAAARAALLPAP
jgi:formiminotetrahydrofolate cyclodeaminase